MTRSSFPPARKDLLARRQSLIGSKHLNHRSAPSKFCTYTAPPKGSQKRERDLESFIELQSYLLALDHKQFADIDDQPTFSKEHSQHVRRKLPKVTNTKSRKDKGESNGQ